MLEYIFEVILPTQVLKVKVLIDQTGLLKVELVFPALHPVGCLDFITIFCNLLVDLLCINNLNVQSN